MVDLVVPLLKLCYIIRGKFGCELSASKPIVLLCMMNFYFLEETIMTIRKQ